MKLPSSLHSSLLFGSVGLLCVAMAVLADPPGTSPAIADEAAPAATPKDDGAAGRVSLAVARDRAALMQDVYAATLEMMHHRYFHGDKAVVPARALEDVFSEIKQSSKIEARWISVNTKSMNIDHDPESDFELRAAKEIAAGKTRIETVEEGYYRLASAIPLTSSCINCHEGFFKPSTKTPKFAGLVISVPVVADATKAE